MKGVLNAYSQAKSMKRVVYTLSVATTCLLNEEGELISGCSLEESRWIPMDFRRGKQDPLDVSIIQFVVKK